MILAPKYFGRRGLGGGAAGIQAFAPSRERERERVVPARYGGHSSGQAGEGILPCCVRGRGGVGAGFKESSGGAKPAVVFFSAQGGRVHGR